MYSERQLLNIEEIVFVPEIVFEYNYCIISIT
jgi:hypothetical protein